MAETWQILVSGRVQGVFYRAGAQQQARGLGLLGYARNLPDGRVEIVAQGAAPALRAFVGWCRQGPPRASVSEVQVSASEPSESFADFSVR